MLVRSEVVGNVAVVTIDNPPANSLGSQTLTDLGAVVGAALQDEQVRVLVITGAGEKIFVAGADIKQLVTLDDEAGRALCVKCKEVFALVTRSPKPVIAAINGIAAGGGLELAMACDMRIAADRAKLGLPEVTLGGFPGAGGTQMLPRLIGPGRAMKLMLTGELIKAEKAAQLGLVDEVCPGNELMAQTMALAGRIAAMPPLAVRNIKACVVDALFLPLEEGLRTETSRFGLLCGTSDKTEGARAFLEGRKPVFTGS